MAKKEDNKVSLAVQLKSLEESINEGTVKNLYFFFGAEKALKNEWKDKMISALTSGNPEMNSCQILSDTYDSQSAECEVTTVPFCSEKRVVVFEGCDIFNKEELLDLFKDIPEETVVIVIQEGLKNVIKDDASNGEDEENQKTKWNFKDIKDVDYERIDFDGEKTQILSSKIKEWAELDDVKIDRAMVDYLIENCGSDSAQLRNEVAKLCSFVKSQNRSDVTQRDINEICTFKLEVEIFQLSNMIEEKKTALAISKFKDLIAKGNKPVSILAYLFSRYELLYRTKLALLDNNSQEILKQVYEGKSPKYVEIMSKISKRFSTRDLKEILGLINQNYMGTFAGTDDTETLIYEIIAKVK